MIAKSKKIPRCPSCHLGGYKLSKEKGLDGRPIFVCDRCWNTFTCGKDGGEFMRVLIEYGK